MEEYLPFIKEKNQYLPLFANEGQASGQLGIGLKTAGFTNVAPDLREEYEDFTLTQIIPESAYQEISDVIHADKPYYQIRAISEEKIAEI